MPDPEEIKEGEIEVEEEAKEIKPTKEELDKQAFEALSPDEREMIESGEGKIVDGEYKVSIGAFRKRLSRETAKYRSEQEKSAALEAAIQAVRETKESKKEDEFDDGYTDEQLDEMVASGDLRTPAKVIAARTFRELRKKEREFESNSFRETAWRNQVSAGDARALQRFPQLNKGAESFDPDFVAETIKVAAKNGYLYQENGQWVYLNPEAMGLAAEEVKRDNPKYKDKVDNKVSTDALNEKLREQRLKKSEMEKGKAAGGDTKQGARPTKADYETAKKFNVPVESIMKFKKVKEATV
uniref:Uncharacterized protein n=1 Tax=viral metagenome TaxID=1070528 RepID=A0A6M3XHK7_9ZZZZ